jgi:pSer/pThr/pTyr-binding forkhead associated (FHA) protein
LDKGSTCGTYVNYELVSAPTSSDEEDISLASRALSNGDIISLGNSQINNFVFVDTRI